MELYLFKSAACLAILMAFYKLFLEKESIHTFKRIYLLLSLMVSFGIPLITLTYYTDTSNSGMSALILEGVSEPMNPATAGIYGVSWATIIWSIYGLGVLFFGIRFSLNFYNIIHKIKQNPKLRQSNFINVLLNSPVVPHTFFSYIFLNRSKFEKQEIPKEVLLHEQAHASQRHSLDILLIEILQIVFWFNPLLYFLKKDIKLNHEFLADQTVMNHGINLITYQQLLLAFSSNEAEPRLANAINYSSIKKRFTVMKTQTSKKKVRIKSFILLPLLAILIFSFSKKEPIERSEEASFLEVPVLQKSATRDQMAEYNKLAIHYNTMLEKGKDITIKMKHVKRMKYIYSIMSAKQRKDAQPFPEFPKPPPPPEAPVIIEELEIEEIPSPAPPTTPIIVKEIEIEEIAPPPPPPPIPANATPAQRAKYKAVIADYAKKHPKKVIEVKNGKGELIELTEVPQVVEIEVVDVPPPPPNPVQHMKELAQEGATFYYEGKKINGKEAIRIANENDNINIQVQDHQSKKPIVKLSTKPFRLKKHN